MRNYDLVYNKQTSEAKEIQVPLSVMRRGFEKMSHCMEKPTICICENKVTR